MAMQIGIRLAAMGVFNNVVLFITYAVVEQDDPVLFDWHGFPLDGSNVVIIASGSVDTEGPSAPGANDRGTPEGTPIPGRGYAELFYIILHP